MTFDFSTALEAFAFILKHLPLTLFLPAVTLLIGIVLGSLVAILRLRSNSFVNAVLAVVVSFFRSVPAILQVFIMYYSLPYIIAPALSWLTGSVVKPFDVSPYWTAYIFFIIYQTAYQSENIRGALLSVDKGQMEAALAAGLTYYQAYKRIILPQAFAVAMPSFFTYYLHGIKSLALLFTIKIVDIFAAADIFAALYSRRTEPYVADAIIYWLLCVVLTFFFNSWERGLSKGLRSANN
ncbi:MAG: amino acid ABC transporter permease [Phascolarctobacterium sp.]